VSQIGEMSPLLDLQDQLNMNAEAINPKDQWLVYEQSSRKSQMEIDIEVLNKEREVLEVIQQDTDRTMQEFELFTQDDFKQNFQNMLYLWSKDNKEYGYR
jgi:hypothetical protein